MCQKALDVSLDDRPDLSRPRLRQEAERKERLVAELARESRAAEGRQGHLEAELEQAGAYQDGLPGQSQSSLPPMTKTRQQTR